jgi:uncharacterized membrane protein YhaH (DUF805 family)
MTFGESIGTCLKKYATVEGRASRSEYWWFVLFSLLLQVAAHVVAGEAAAGIVALVLLLPGVGVGGRRLHDMGRSAWWLLVGLIPIVGVFILIYWLVQPSAGSNQYGEAAAAPAAS